MFLLLLAQTGVVLAPPASSVYVPAPIVTRSSASDRMAAMRESVPLDVVVRVPQGVLRSGRLLVDGARGASWRQSQSEAVASSCEQVDLPFGASQREASVTLRRVMRSDMADDLFSVEARWTRPRDAGCGGTSTIELRQTVTLAVGATQTLKGDGGLVVELRRR
ncbi:hypothetical protein [Sphingomonas sp. Mn802worker]|uniref:hypothetical protein n=1 Tax=Sphingomonas sp. Mn802worker TaxID=629773 RepID=UPI000378C17B|nr:hypothetical protein [Sphingomonas sp. Mn802worker]